ncbi:uncharacterized protein F5Z01DRAFT_622611 [Emericellopsis atlantica]|uniref:Zn(2)-C6 fungal-type domain-containing protein n=1 Tax=Emericellopsis atlantica TaxID=2614577 RepID=A0A9P8CP06_9HYPO|nr:uncharacterized protein F5Z01DRAFT_622611 [Emericellopsis atlantica]KAG9254053.1 hypothetical protein F5Z01DRAFT_622611 [Emericellopsis atlantica]
MSAGADDPNRRACDQCRMRKVRCDKDYPCANCRTAKRPCTSTGLGQRPKEPRQRVLISSQYERKIDQIESRLGSIESLLKNISSSGSSSVHHHVSTPSSHPTASSQDNLEESDDDDSVGGDAGFASQTAFATEFIEHAVQRTSLREVNPNVNAALNNLRQLVEVQKGKSISHGPRFPHQKPLPPGGVVKLPLPPLDVVVSLLKSSKHSAPSLFSLSCGLAGIRDFSSLCRNVYFPTDDVTPAMWAIVNAGLYNLFMEEYSLADDVAKRDMYHEYGLVAQANQETFLANLPLFQSAKVENVQALVFGAQYAIDVCRPSVAWHLNCMAALLCQAGGFHRAEVLANDPPKVAQVKAIVFWQVYTWDKGLSLRLGRSSIMKDYDISIPEGPSYEGFKHLEKSDAPQLWLTISKFQGKTFEDLYSPAALRESKEELSRRAQSLAVNCRGLWDEVEKSRDETITYLRAINTSKLVDIFIIGDEIQFLSVLTMVYRAIPAPPGSPSRFNEDCLETARKCITAHQTGMGLLTHGAYVKSIYVHWNLMLTPFAPFFVLFCHVIESLSSHDLEILQQFVDSINRLRDASEQVEKLYRVFQVYRDVAMVYVDAKSQQQEDQTMVPIGDELDMYLSQLGFMPGLDQNMAASHPSTGAPMMQTPVMGGQQTQMADWFSGNRNMFGLMEEDLSQMNTLGYMPSEDMAPVDQQM